MQEPPRLILLTHHKTKLKLSDYDEYWGIFTCRFFTQLPKSVEHAPFLMHVGDVLRLRGWGDERPFEAEVRDVVYETGSRVATSSRLRGVVRFQLPQ